MFPLGHLHHQGLASRRADLRAFESAIEANRDAGLALLLQDQDQHRSYLCTFLGGQAHSAVEWVEDDPRPRPSTPSAAFGPVRDGRSLHLSLHAIRSLSLLATAITAAAQPVFAAPARSLDIARVLDEHIETDGLVILNRAAGTSLLAFINDGVIARVLDERGELDGEAARTAFDRAADEAEESSLILVYDGLEVARGGGAGPFRHLIAEVEPPSPLLLETEGDHRRVQMAREEILLGRSPDNDVVVDEPQVSRRHAMLRWRGDHYDIVDLGSRHGTRVNNQPVVEDQPARVAPGDTVSLGAHAIKVLEPVLELAETNDSKPRSNRRDLVEPFLIHNARPMPIDRTVMQLRTGNAGPGALGGAPGAQCTLVRDAHDVILHNDSPGVEIYVNDQRVRRRRRRLSSGDRIRLGNVPLVFVMMTPPVAPASELEVALKAYLRNR